MSIRIALTMVLAAAILAFALGLWLGNPGISTPERESEESYILHYICPMHPQYVSDRDGDCPSCGMRLVAVYEDGGPREELPGGMTSLPSGTIQVSLEKQQLAGVRTASVQRLPASLTLRTIGRVEPDEKLLYRVVAAVDGWIHRIYEDSTGSLVEKDQRLASIYSPLYRNTQEAYITGLYRRDLVSDQGKQATGAVESVDRNLDIYRDQLRNIGMGDSQIEEIARTKQPAEYIHIHSPGKGFVLSRNVFLGQRFLNGQELYKIADLGRVWVVADLFEHESRFVKAGQKVKVSYQGHDYQARVSEVLPQFDPDSRTLKVRLEMDNPGYVLRPDMFVDVEFPIELPPAVTVPSDAIVDSGLRKTVFVDLGNGYFEPRIVQSGWRFGDRVEITQGLEPGEEIVVEGNFLLDSESRMKAAAAGIQAPARDPVCGMEVDQIKAKAAGRTSEYEGRTYYFCCDQCKGEFDKDPGSYLSPVTGEKGRETAAVIDPVCGMKVDPSTAKYISRFEGEAYYFCSEMCKKSFDKNPEKYISDNKSAARAD